MSTDILETIAASNRYLVAEKQKIKPLDTLMAEALAMECDTGFPFEAALRNQNMAFICECKKASPSKGLIAPEFPYLEIAKAYEAAGAAAISVLTEPKWFLGSDAYLQEKIRGAAAVLLICALLDEKTLAAYIRICDCLGLSALVEAHDEQEIRMAVDCGASAIGVNNRNLRDFTVDVENSARLRQCAPKDVLFVAESGIRTPEDVERLRQADIHTVLIGETLMRAEDKTAMLRHLRGEWK